MKIFFDTTAEREAFLKMMFEILLALAKLNDKTDDQRHAIANIEHLFYSMSAV
jgi:hypothetical protein